MQSNFIEITLRQGCSPVNLLHVFRTPFPKNTSGVLLLPRFDFNMATAKTIMTKAKKVTKDSPYECTHKMPWLFINFLYLLYTYFSNSLSKVHEVAKYIIFYSKKELLNPLGASLKIKKTSLKNYMIKTTVFQRNIELFYWSEIEYSI